MNQQEEKQKKILDNLKAKEAQRLKNLAEEISKIERDSQIALEQKAKDEIEKEILLIETRREKKEKETALAFKRIEEKEREKREEADREWKRRVDLEEDNLRKREKKFDEEQIKKEEAIMMLDKKQDDEEKNRKKQWEKEHNNEVHTQHANKEASREKDLLFFNKKNPIFNSPTNFQKTTKRRPDLLLDLSGL